MFKRACHYASILSQMNSVYTLPSKFFNIHFNIILMSMPQSTKWSLPLSFLHLNPACIYPLPHTYRIPCHLIILDFDTIIIWFTECVLHISYRYIIYISKHKNFVPLKFLLTNLLFVQSVSTASAGIHSNCHLVHPE